jgi:hypothetical protein
MPFSATDLHWFVQLHATTFAFSAIDAQCFAWLHAYLQLLSATDAHSQSVPQIHSGCQWHASTLTFCLLHFTACMSLFCFAQSLACLL